MASTNLPIHHAVMPTTLQVQRAIGALAESLIASGGLDPDDVIDAWRAEGRNVLVHCHGGRSRTALVLKAWAMRRQGWTETEAHQWLEGQWHRYDPWNHTFSDFLRTEWPA